MQPSAAVRATAAMQALGTLRAVRAEWTKLRTVPGSWWLLVAVVALTVAAGGASAAAVTTEHCHPTPAACQEDTVKLSLTGVWVGQAAVAILGALAMSSEYGTGTIRAALTAVPWRGRLLTAKAVVVSALALTTGALGVLGSLLVGRLVLPGNGFTAEAGYPPLSLADGPTLRAAVGSMLYLGLIALLALGVAALVRDTAGAITVVLALLYVFPVLVSLVSSEKWRERLQEWGPASAGMAVQATRNLHSLPIGPWPGLGVLALYAAAALLAGGLTFRLRDA
ncbi:ABC transporter permease subunit [Streptomyces cavernae]|uniref:ABC transporter permease subunit n=1 Tax=Streptomyces cavernae TaxID=2259034 RepID=UPI001EE41EB0|nr:ABC transporter permease [Streptomyces cavernae]